MRPAGFPEGLRGVAGDGPAGGSGLRALAGRVRVIERGEFGRVRIDGRAGVLPADGADGGQGQHDGAAQRGVGGGEGEHPAWPGGVGDRVDDGVAAIRCHPRLLRCAGGFSFGSDMEIRLAFGCGTGNEVPALWQVESIYCGHCPALFAAVNELRD